MMRLTRASWIAAFSLLLGGVLSAQAPAPSTPAFSIASSHIYSTREHPVIMLGYRQVDHLDFRVYRVNDPFAFFARLRDPHQLGSEEPVVPQEQTWLERIAFWKAARRADARAFVRRQFTPAYRRVRQERQDAQQVVQRRVVAVHTFAQVPLLNAAQLVTSWRELLPQVRDTEFRRVPLEVSTPGVYVIEAVNPPLKAYTVVIVSDLGLVTKAAPGELLLFAANRFSGEPAAGCRMEIVADTIRVATGTTGDDGIFATPVAGVDPDRLVTVAQCGHQVAATDPGAFALREPAKELAGYLYTDRPVYRPGHTVRFKGVLRWREQGRLSAFERKPVEVAIADTNDKVLWRESRTPDEFGAVAGSFTVPVTAPLGTYSVRVTTGDRTASGTFEVQEYRKPEFDVAVRPAARRTIQGGAVSVTIAARYYFGQPVAGASVKYVVHRQPYFSPLRYDESSDEDDGGWYGGDEQLEGTARLNDAGTADVSVPLALDDHGRDYTARIEARVIDASGREVSGASSVNATVGRFLLIAKPERFVVSPGSTAAVGLRAVDYDGAAQAGVAVRAVLEKVDYSRGYNDPQITEIQTSTFQTDADGRARWTLTMPQVPGSYRVTATANADGRSVTDSAYLYVPGRTDRLSEESDQILELVADRRSYQPGDSARLLIRGADFDAAVLVTKENQHVSYHRVVRRRGNDAIEVPVDDLDVGDTYVSVAFLKDDRLYRAERRLTVPATARQLTITATPDRTVSRPGEPATFALHVADAAGHPVRAQLSVGVVDEALYGVRPDATADPLRFFYRREYNDVSTSFSRDYPFVGYSGTDQLLLARRRRPLTLADFKADRPDRPKVRKDFPDAIYWIADLTTDAGGNAQVRVDYPDSLTTWRLTARAITTTTEVGVATARTTTTKDLLLRIVAPRFLTEGDEVIFPTIVHNYLPDAKSVAVSFAADGLSQVAPGDSSNRTVTVPSNGQQRLDWPFKAEQVRTVTLAGKALTDVESDAVAMSLPVLPAGLRRDLGSSGSLVGEAADRTLELTVPSAANASARTISVSLAPSLAGTLLGALDYLTSYPYGCTEQTLSSFVPNLSVLHALSQAKLAPTERLQALDRQVADGLKRLYDYQHEDGGWGWWKTDQNDPFMTAYALDGLVQARAEGVKIEDWRVSTARRALVQISAKYPRAIPDLKAYIAYALTRAEDPEDPASAPPLDALWAARDRMTASGQALLLMTLDRRKDARGDALAHDLEAAAQTRGDVAWWPVDRDPLLDDLVDTSVEASALALKALVARDPKSPLLERVARWLVLNRSAGDYWVSTKQTALALDGLLAYMQARGERPAPLRADVFVNGTLAGSHAFAAASLASPDPIVVTAPASSGVNTVRVAKQGQGTLYYSADLRYYDPPASSQRTGSRHLALVRTYAALVPVQRGNRIVYREAPIAPAVHPGDLLLVRLTAAGSSDWRYLMLEDPLPAGAEPVEHEELYELERRRSSWFGSQREFRDDRVVFFQERFTQGRYEYSYLLRVTTPGTFTAMPARIAPMYVPDAAASSEAQRLTVTPGPEASR